MSNVNYIRTLFVYNRQVQDVIADQQVPAHGSRVATGVIGSQLYFDQPKLSKDF